MQKEINDSAWGMSFDLSKCKLYLPSTSGKGKRGGIMLEDARTLASYRLSAEVLLLPVLIRSPALLLSVC
jgi:hypothetical protein